MDKKKVLIIDDEDFIVELIKDILILEDIDCISADNFEDGFKVFQKQGCDIILADKNIENSSLEDFVGKVRGAGKQTPIVLITGERGIGDEELMRTGIDEVVYKPFKMDNFLETVKRLMGSR